MFKDYGAFSSFSVDDAEVARRFYGETLGLKVLDVPDMPGPLNLCIPGGGNVLLDPKDDHQPATFTVLNFLVDDVDAAVDALTAKGVTFEVYDDDMLKTDERGVMRGGPGPTAIAWFKDPAGNILSILNEPERAEG